MSSNRELIQIASMLLETAKTDDRVVELAQAAKQIVLSSDEAVADLFSAYLKQPDSRPVNPFVQRMLNNQPTKSNEDTANLIQQILEKAQQQ